MKEAESNLPEDANTAHDEAAQSKTPGEDESEVVSSLYHYERLHCWQYAAQGPGEPEKIPAPVSSTASPADTPVQSPGRSGIPTVPCSISKH